MPVQTPASFARLWLATLFLAALLLPLVNLAFVNRSNDTELAWIDAIYQRKDAYARQTEMAGKPRLFVIGGSASIFGIDCQLIERKLNIPTVNYATHAGLGLRYLLARAERQLRPGDTALLCLEYSLCWNDDYCADMRRDFALTYDPRYLTEVPTAETARMLYSVPLDAYEDSLNAWWNSLIGGRRKYGPYAVATMSPNGDARHVSNRLRNYDPAFVPDLDPQLLADLRAFCDRARRNNIRLLATFPNAWCGQTSAEIHSRLAGARAYVETYAAANVPILATPEQCAFPRFMFMDTQYHIDQAGRRIRTERLIRNLRPHFGLPLPPDDPAAPTYVMAADRQPLTPGNIFADRPAIRFRYLAPGDPLPSGELFFDDRDDDIKRNVVGLAPTVAASDSLTIPDLLRRYPNHIFLFALARTSHIDFDLPQPFPQQDGYRVGIIGTGRYASIHDTLVSPSRCGITRPTGTRFPGGWRSPLDITLRSGSGQPTPALRFPIILNNTPLFPTNTTGLAIAVLDPDLAIVLERHTFTAPSVTAWQLDRVVVPATAHPQSQQQQGG